MQRLRLKADGRIVELRDGREFPLAPSMPFAPPARTSVALATTAVALATTSVAPATTTVALEMATSPAVRDLRRRAPGNGICRAGQALILKRL